MRKVILFKAESEKTTCDTEDPYFQKLVENNIDVQIVHSLHFQFDNPYELKKKLFNPKFYSGIIFTSPRCVKAVSECLGKDVLPDEWKSSKIFVISETTDNLVRSKLNLCSTIGSSADCLNSLLPIIIENVTDFEKPLLYPVGNLASNELTERLKEKSIKVEKIEVYKTMAHPALEKIMKILTMDDLPDVVVYFSPSGIKFTEQYFQENFKKKVKFVAIGPTTQKALEKAGLPVTCISERPNPDSLLEAIKSAFIDS